MIDFSNGFDSFESSNLDFADDLKNKHKVEMIDINKLNLNPLNPQFDTDEEVKELADKIYHNPKGIIDTLACYRNENGDYTLLSGHKRLKAVRYNIEHAEELDGAGHIQKNVNCIVIPKPQNEIEEQQLIMDFNGYRKFETDFQKKALFLQGYQLYALKKLNGQFNGRAREEIAKSTGLGKMKVGELKKELEDQVFKYALEVLELINKGKEINKYDYIVSKTHLPKETIQVAFESLSSQLKNGSRKKYATNKKKELTEEQKAFKSKLDDVERLARVKLECPVSTNFNDDKFTIKITSTTENYERIIKALGLLEGNNDAID